MSDDTGGTRSGNWGHWGPWAYTAEAMAAVAGGLYAQAPLDVLRDGVRRRVRGCQPHVDVAQARRDELLAVLASIGTFGAGGMRQEQEAAEAAKRAYADQVARGEARWAHEGDHVRHLVKGWHSILTRWEWAHGFQPDLTEWEVIPPALAVTDDRARNPYTGGACYEIRDIGGGWSRAAGWAGIGADGSFGKESALCSDGTRPGAGAFRDWLRVIDEHGARKALQKVAARRRPHRRHWRELPGGIHLRDLASGGYLLVSPDRVREGRWRWQEVSAGDAEDPRLPSVPTAGEGGLPSADRARAQAADHAGLERREQLAGMRGDALSRIQAGHAFTARSLPPGLRGEPAWKVCDEDDRPWARVLRGTEDELREVFRGGRLAFPRSRPGVPAPPPAAGQGHRVLGRRPGYRPSP